MNSKEQEEIFYSTADTTVQFSDGTTIKFNKRLLCSRSNSIILNQLLFGPINEEDTISLNDTDPDIFKLFIDCVMGFQDYTFENSVKIFPLAIKYEIENCINNCITSLTPRKINENLCDALNLAKYYKCQKLLDVIKNFLCHNYDSFKLLEYEEYSTLLTAESMVELVKCLEMDSYLWGALLRWALFFITTNNKTCTVVDLFQEIGIMKSINLNTFESSKLLSEFGDSEIGLYFYPNDDISRRLKEMKRSLPKKCKWVKIEEGQSIVEKFQIQRRLLSQKKLSLSIDRNKAVFYNIIFYNQPVSDHKNQEMMSCEITVSGNSNNNYEKSFNYDSFNQKFSPRGHSIVTSDKNETIRVTIKWTFNFNCRILFTSFRPISGPFDLFHIVPVSGFIGKFYFTSGIRCSHYHDPSESS